MKLLVPTVSEIFRTGGGNPTIIIPFDDSTSLFGIQLVISRYVYRPSRSMYSRWSYNTESIGMRIHIRRNEYVSMLHGDTQLVVLRGYAFASFITKFQNKSITQEDLVILVDKLNSNAILHKRLTKLCFTEF